MWPGTRRPPPTYKEAKLTDEARRRDLRGRRHGSLKDELVFVITLPWRAVRAVYRRIAGRSNASTR